VPDDFWYPPVELPLGHGKVATGKEVPPVLVMAWGYSRWMLGLIIPCRHAENLVLGTWQLLQQLGGVRTPGRVHTRIAATWVTRYGGVPLAGCNVVLAGVASCRGLRLGYGLASAAGSPA